MDKSPLVKIVGYSVLAAVCGFTALFLIAMRSDSSWLLRQLLACLVAGFFACRGVVLEIRAQRAQKERWEYEDSMEDALERWNKNDEPKS